MLGLGAIGCSSHRGSNVIAIISKSSSTDLSKQMHAGALHGLARDRYTVQWSAPQEDTDYTRQANMVRDAIEHRVRGIVLMPDHQLVLAASVQQARQAGIPVVIVDAPIALPPTDYTAFVGSNDGAIGTLAADRLGALLAGHGTVGIIGVSPMLEGSNLRESVFAQRLHTQYPGIHLIGTAYGLSDWAHSTEMADRMIAENPHLDGIFASDGFATMGTIAVLRRHQPRHIRLIGVDQETYVLDALRAGYLDGVVATDWFTLGELSMQVIEAALAHEPFARHTEIPVELVTRENITQPEIQRYLPPPVMEAAPARSGQRLESQVTPRDHHAVRP